MKPVELTEEDVLQPVELTEEDMQQPVELTEADVLQPVELTEEDVRQPVELTEADVRQPIEQPGGALDILPSGEQASAGMANMLRGIAQAPLTLADKTLASAQFSGRAVELAPTALKVAFNPLALPLAVNKFAWHLATGGDRDKLGLRQALGDVRKKLDTWRESNLGYRDEQGRPATGEDWGVTFGGQVANSVAEIYLAKGAARAAGAAPVANAAGAPLLQRLRALRPSALSIIYGGSQAESTAQKAEDAGRGPLEQVTMGAATGAWETALESVSQLFGLQATAENAVGKSIAKAMRIRALHVLAEGGEEFAQQAGSAGMEKLDGINESTWAEIGQQSAVAFALGLASAGAAESGSAASQLALNKAQRRVQETRDAEGKRAEVRGQRSEVRGQRSEVRGQRAEVENPTDNSYPADGLAQQAEDIAQPLTSDVRPLTSDFLPPTPEQEAQATTQAEDNAAKDYAPRKVMGANVSDALIESNPVKAMVLEFGGIRMDGTEDQRGIPVSFRSKSPNAQTLDQMLNEIQRSPDGARFADWTTDDLIDALKGSEADKRRNLSARQADPEERAWLKSAWTVTPENLALGFSFNVKGIPYRVADSDETGYVIERTDGKDAGWAIRLDYGKMMNIDGGTLANTAGKKLAKIKNYADPEQVRFWQESGADEAAQAGEGFATEEDEDQPFRAGQENQKSEVRSQKSEDVTRKSYLDIYGDLATTVGTVLENINDKALEKQIQGAFPADMINVVDLATASFLDESVVRRLSEAAIQQFDQDQYLHSVAGYIQMTRQDYAELQRIAEDTQPSTDWQDKREKIKPLAKRMARAVVTNLVEKTNQTLLNLKDIRSQLEDSIIMMLEGNLEDDYSGAFITLENNEQAFVNLHIYGESNLSSKGKTALKRIRNYAKLAKTDNEATVKEDADTNYRATAAKPVAQIRVVRRGYDETREAADDPTFTQWAQNPVDLPELVEMATELMDGKVPRVLKNMAANSNAVGFAKFKGEQNAAGKAVFGRPEMIALLAANYKLVSDDEAETIQAEADAKAKEIEGDKTDAAGVPLWQATAKTLFDEAYYAEVKSRVAAGPRFAMAVIAHEIGHIADQAAKYGLVKPDRSQGKNRLNLIGRVAGMLSWTRDILADDPGGRTLSADEIRTLQGRARKSAKPDSRGKELMRAITEKWATMPELNELAADPQLVNMVNAGSFRDALEYMARDKPVLAEWFSITTFPEQVRYTMEALKTLTKGSKTARHLGSAWFRAEFVKGLEAQRQAHLGQMYSELESLIAWWNSGDKTMMDKYYERPSEMFAEAFGVYLNNPGAVKKRAPMFFRTLIDYMGARPEVQEWLDAFNQDMARGPQAKHDVRDARLTDMFSKNRREQNRAVEQAGQAGVTKRLTSDAARYMLSRKSGPLHALIATADALGLSGITGRVAKWSDQVENVAGLEKMFAGEMNEVGRILEEGGLTVEDFDKWAYLNMVAKSPAYTQRANPLGFHPQAAREQIDFLTRQMGDARANQLQKAVERFQTLWLANVVDRVDGMYSEATMTQLRANPVYFTLMVGMDDAEIKAFQTAMQTLNADQMLAYAQRTVNASVFGQPVPGGIIRRVGTHRPAMSLFGATLLKGVRMINDATRNRLAVDTRALLETLKDPYFMDIPEGTTATDTRSQTVVRYFENGVKKAYYAPKFVGHYVRGDNPSQAFNNGMEVLRKYTLVNVWKRLQTMWSVRFMTTQPIADAKAWNTQMPGVRTPIGNVARGNVLGGLAQMLPASTWYLPASVFPANSRERLMRPAREVIRRFYKTGEIDPRLRDLVERGMSDLNGAFQGVSRIDPDAGEILQLFAGIKPSKALEVYEQDLNAFQRGWKKLEAIPAFGKLFSFTGRSFEALQQEMQVETLANKMAGMEYLDSKYPGMDERDKRRWVLHAAGNPNFAARAGADPFVDTLIWTFFNPAKEGYRSLYMAAKADPAGFMARSMWYNVAPNLIKWGAASGILAAVAYHLIPHGATPEDEEDRNRYMEAFKAWCSWFKRIPGYYGRRWVTIPIQPVGQDSVLTITIPQAQSLAPINGLVNAMLDEMAQLTGYKEPDNKGMERTITAITDDISGINFLSGHNRSAFVQVFGPIIEMLTTDKTNVYDPFYGRDVLDINEEQLMAGGRFSPQAWPAWEKLGKNAWNNAFGSALGRFDTKTPRSDMPLKTDLQKVLSYPGVSSLVGGLLRVTGGGEFERMQDMFSAEGQNRAYDNVMVRKAAIETLNDPMRRFPAWATEKYLDDPKFQRDWNEYIISHDIYSGMSVQERALYSHSNPIWKRMMLIREQQKRSE